MPPSPRESEVPYPTPLCLVILGMRLMAGVGAGQEAAAPAQPSACVPTLYLACIPHGWPHPRVLCCAVRA